MGSTTCFGLSKSCHSHPKESCILSPMPWKIFCGRGSCPDVKTVWFDYYGFSVTGGYDYGQLLYVKSAQWCMRSGSERKLKVGDILLEANGYKLAGTCMYFVYAIMEKLWEENIVLELTVLPGDHLSGNFDLVQFLQDNTFPSGSFKRDLQLEIRHAIYRQYPPVTSRPPSDDERGKKFPYSKYFFRAEKRLAEDLEKLRFLERGDYGGHFYGTIMPVLNRDTARTFENAIGWLDNPSPTRRMSFKKAIGMLPADCKEEVPEDDLSTRTPW